MNLKRRLIVSLTIILATTIALPLLIIYVKNYSIRAYIYSYIICLLIMTTFFLGGFSKLIISLFYALLISILIYALYKYELIIMALGAILFVLNPLRFFERFLREKFKENTKTEFRNIVKDDEYIFYSYTNEMKKIFHSVSLSLYNKNHFYHFLRNITSSIMISFAIFVSFYYGVPYRDFLKLPYINLIMVSYIILVLLISGYLVKEKSFNSCFRFLNLFSIPFLLFVVYSASPDSLSFKVKIILFSILSLALLVLIIAHVIFYFRRVTFHEYEYISEKGEKTVANALYEPYIYLSGYKLIGIYQIRCDYDYFKMHFKKFLIYSNYHKFIITGYKIFKNEIKLFTCFKTRDYRKPKKFAKYLSNNLSTNDILINTIVDEENIVYPREFSKDKNYIIQRAIKSANYLKEIELRKSVIISLFFHFENNLDLLKFQEENLSYIYLLSNMEKIVETQFVSRNDNYKIEVLIRKLLLSAEQKNGEYLRIVVKYPNKKIII